MTAPEEPTAQEAALDYPLLGSVPDVTPDPAEPVDWLGVDLDLAGALVTGTRGC